MVHSVKTFLGAFFLWSVLLGGPLTADPVAGDAGKLPALKYKILVNADFSHNPLSAIAIRQGIEVALLKARDELGRVSISVEECDHRGIGRRSDKCVKKYASDPSYLAMYGGLHSPPLITNLMSKDPAININKLGVLTLLPWSAAGVLTRAGQDDQNWVFRLSLDDKYAGRFIYRRTADEGFKKIALLLVDDGWGQFNRKQITGLMTEEGKTPASVLMFPRTLQEADAALLLQKIHTAGAEAVIVVANYPQFATLLMALDKSNLTKSLAIRSHWGVLGGDLWKAHSEILKKADFQVIRTKYDLNQHDDLAKLMEQTSGGKYRSFSDINESVGFVHAYDLTRILVRAIRESLPALVGNRDDDKKVIHTRFEQGVKFAGIIKDYEVFKKNTKDHADGHEALGVEDFAMYQFCEQGRLLPVADGKGASKVH